jgi:hypothetical protein
MMDMPVRDLAKCRANPDLEPACPTRVPSIEITDDLGHRSFVDEPGDEPFSVFFAEWGAPYRNRLNARDRPPRFLHVVVEAGDLRRAYAFWPGQVRPIDKRLPPARDLGARAWNKMAGRLVLTPPYPFGGLHGSHLIFRWGRPGHEFAVSLHAWKPLAEAEEALRRIVESIP